MTLASDETSAPLASAPARPRLALAAFDGLLRKLSRGRLEVQLPDGSERSYGEAGAEPVARMRISDWRFFRRVLMAGDVGLGESYSAGEWRSDDLVSLLGVLLLNLETLDRPTLASRIGLIALRLLHARRANRRDRARLNIRAHYDLGNEFYRLFLDDSMTYSSALFESPQQTLDQAQRAKILRLLGGLGLRRDEHLLEIGCGWGACAVLAAREFGCRVTGITLSEEQASHARRRVAAEGLSDRIAIEIVDYRDVSGRFDHIVSIEMLEAVGHRYLPGYFAACNRLLRPGGRLALQTITLPDQRYVAYRKRPDWIQKHIFPGGHLPSLGAILAALRPTPLLVRDALDIGPHYATTLRHWRERFLAARERVHALGFDAAFARTWEYYLAYCEAGFAGGATQDFQLLLAKPG